MRMELRKEKIIHQHHQHHLKMRTKITIQCKKKQKGLREQELVEARQDLCG